MASSLPASLFLLSVVFCQFVSAAEQTNIKATAGEDVTLPCSDPDNNPIQVIEWSRPGLGAKFVLLFKDGKTDVNKQHPSFKDRVELLDSEMTGGDVSLVLKKVQANDTGLFECRVIQMAHGEELRRKVYLDVIEPFPPWVIVLLVLLSVTLTATTVLVYKYRHYFNSAPAAQQQQEDDDDYDDEDDETKMNSED
ncbi:butyrophilin-like protein 3 isoform X3 [Xiphophorus couchianus]|uniref:butyrophilin-like protein 3 isoform X3 n=1 Tax=Xiphophorus couchianus TaxID=32473 RepID=UPI0010168FF0|nr:butyrophilin-like protein 3 isoform X3 [Xiphophorus couchianus]